MRQLVSDIRQFLEMGKGIYHRASLIMLGMIILAILSVYFSHHTLLSAIGYAAYFIAAITLINRFSFDHSNGIREVRNPVSEILVIGLFMLIGFSSLTLMYYAESNEMILDPMLMIPFKLGYILFALPVAIFVYLMKKGYSLEQLGVSFSPYQNLLAGVLIWALAGIFTLLLVPENIHWTEISGNPRDIYLLLGHGIMFSAIPEEFMRYIVQNRIGRILRSPLAGILMATIIWALFHFPLVYLNQELSLAKAIVYCVKLIPIGFIWGFLSYKSKSFIPASIAHGLNIWGM